MLLCAPPFKRKVAVRAARFNDFLLAAAWPLAFVVRIRGARLVPLLPSLQWIFAAPLTFDASHLDLWRARARRTPHRSCALFLQVCMGQLSATLLLPHWRTGT